MNFTTSKPEIKEASCFVGDKTITRVARIAIYVVIISISVFGNLLVIAIAHRSKLLEKTTNLFIVNMCVADLLITVLYMPRAAAMFVVGYEWLLHGTLGLSTCKAVPFLMEVATAVTIFTVVLIGIDRVLSVCFPFKKIIQKRFSQVLIIAIWLLAAAFRFPVLFIELREENGKLFCNLNLDHSFSKGASKTYYQTIMISIYIIPVLIIILCYICLIVSIRRFKSARHLSTEERSSREARNRSMLRLIVIVISCFIMCWFLYSVIFVLDAYQVYISCELRFLRLVLAHSNSAITPCLYFIFSEHYREGLRKILKIWRRNVPDNREIKSSEELTMSRRKYIGTLSI